MYLTEISHYIPTEEVPNSYFETVNGLSDDWIVARTGIRSRSKAKVGENTNTMSIEAVKALSASVEDVDLIVGASYTPHDTIATIAHVVQREFNITNAQGIYVSSACSSLINALEIVEGYFAMNKATKALVVASEHNWAYSNEEDEKSGHLWGDGATALLITKDKTPDSVAEILDIHTRSLAHLGKGPEGVYLEPLGIGLTMPFGKDVFVNACLQMEEALFTVLKRKNFTVDDVDYLISHQANERIISNLAKRLNKMNGSVLRNIDRLGNTGSASTGICISENIEILKQNKALLAVTVFGGGYSSGAMLCKFL